MGRKLLKVLLDNNVSFGTPTAPFTTNYQGFEINLPILTASVNHPIASSPLATSMLMFHGQRVPINDVPSRYFANMIPTSATNILAERLTSSMIETNIQGGMITGSSNLLDKTEFFETVVNDSQININTAQVFDVSRSVVHLLGYKSSSNGVHEITTSAELVNNIFPGQSTVVFRRGTSLSFSRVTVGVYEFKRNAVISAQTLRTPLVIPIPADRPLMKPVNPDYTLCFYGGQILALGDGANQYVDGQLLNGSTFRLNQASTRTPKFAIVDFHPAVFAQAVQRGRTTIPAMSGQVDVAINPVLKIKCALSYLGFSTLSTPLDPSNYFTEIELVQLGGDATRFDHVRVRRGNIVALTSVTTSWEVAEFN